MIQFDIPDFRAFARELDMDGWLPGTPSPDCDEDRLSVEDTQCRECGGFATFFPVKRWNHARQRFDYRAFGMCANCGAGFEF